MKLWLWVPIGWAPCVVLRRNLGHTRGGVNTWLRYLQMANKKWSSLILISRFGVRNSIGMFKFDVVCPLEFMYMCWKEGSLPCDDLGQVKKMGTFWSFSTRLCKGKSMNNTIACWALGFSYRGGQHSLQGIVVKLIPLAS